MRRALQEPIGITIFLLVVVLVEYYNWVAIRKATQRFSKRWRLAFVLFHILLTLSLWICMINIFTINQAVEGTWIGKYAAAIMMGLMVSKLLIAVIMILGDIYVVLKKILSPKSGKNIISEPADDPVDLTKSGISRSTFISQLAIATGALTTGTFLYGTSNKYNYTIKRVPLTYDNLPAAFDGLKIAHITDIHCGSFDNPAAVLKGVQKIMAEQPDIIFFTGDLVNNIAPEVVPYKEIFKQLRAPLGVFAVLGNHDYGDYHKWSSPEGKAQNLADLKQHIADMGWELMINRHIVYDKYGDRLAIIGVENWSAKSNFPQYGDLTKAYGNLAEKEIPFKILLTHDPSHWDAEVRPSFPDIDLTLSGHTHGMQFGIRLPWMQWSPVKYVYKQWLGLYEASRQKLYISAGFGFIGYKGRVGILPEITIIELKRPS